VIVAIVNAVPAVCEAPMAEMPNVSGGIVTTVFAIELPQVLVAGLFVVPPAKLAQYQYVPIVLGVYPVDGLYEPSPLGVIVPTFCQRPVTVVEQLAGAVADGP
jgi:hypothetical protein